MVELSFTLKKIFRGRCKGLRCNYNIIWVIFAFMFSITTVVFSQIEWIKNPNNPVLSGGASGTWNRHVFMPCVLFNVDSSRYEMWFGASVGPQPEDWRPYRIGFAVSYDGTNWTMLDTAVLKPDPGEWDESTVEGQVVLRENGEYKMWYTGWSDGPSGIGYATSPDGINWTKDPNNPIMEPGTAAWEAGGPYWCTVMPVQEGYKMWYVGATQQYDSQAIGHAWSPDGIAWQRDTLNNPVLTTGLPGEWDDEYISEPRVLFLDGTYYMWYTGFHSNGGRAGGLAISPDGINWTKYDDPTTTNPPYSESDPVLKPSPGQWDRNQTEPGFVILIRDTLNMWYDGSRNPTGIYLWRIGHATSPYTPVGIDDYIFLGIPEGYVLSQNYPNPFNPSTTIDFNLPKTSDVTLKIYNILGEEVATIVSDRLTAGNYTYDWLRPAGIASGVYLYRLQAGDYVETRKMVLIR